MPALLEMRGITKTFPGVRALDNVNLTVQAGEIHAICGENGAGKSTLMKVLSGVYPHGTYDGEIRFNGETRTFRDIRDSEHVGIIIIHQELALVPLLSIAENIFLGNEVSRFGVIDWSEAFRRTVELLAQVGLTEAPTTLVKDIGIGKQQLVEIVKALSKKVRLLILDEPTASLNEKDSQALLDLLLKFKAQGMTSIMISHKLNEISKVADSITVIRDGSTVSTLDFASGSITEDRIIRDMVGRQLDDRYPPRRPNIGAVLFEVKDWTAHHHLNTQRQVVKGVSLNVRKGEIVGIAGLMGAGRTELAMSIFGQSYGRNVSGEARMNGTLVDVSSVPRAINAGVAYVTEDRKQLGLILEEDIRQNVSLANLSGIAKGGVIDSHRERVVAEEYRTNLRIRSSNIFHKTLNLSGGNQQKVVLSKWLFSNPELLILDEPTRGIDVGAKFEIYSIIERLASEGKGILMISSEMPELLGMCDRIYVMNEGRLVAEMPRAEASQESIMRAIIRSAGRTAA